MTEMTRAEALERAIEAAGYAERSVDIEFINGQAHLAEAWVAIHDRLPAGRKSQWSGRTGQAHVQYVKECGHGVTAWLQGDHWVHPTSMVECDNPPVTNGPLP